MERGQRSDATVIQTDHHEGRFCSAEHLLEDAQWPALAHLRPAAEAALPAVCSVHQMGEDRFYRLDDSRLLAWLTLKVDATVAALRAGAAAGAAFEALDDSQLRAYSVDLFGEYLSSAHMDRLRAHLGCTAVPADVTAAPAAAHVPAMTHFEEPEGKRPKPAPVLSAAAKQSAARAASMKEKNAKAAQGCVSLASFFNKK